jgi:hypothetical protein
MADATHQLESFVEEVRVFCDWVEKPPANSDSELKILMRLLAQLHIRVLELPEFEAGDDDIEPEQPSQEALGKICGRFGSLPVNYYTMCFDPLAVPPEEPVEGSLADDVSDIYSDLKQGLSLYDAGHTSEAGWQWNFSFLTHWGKHLTSAQCALHSYADKTFFDEGI